MISYFPGGPPRQYNPEEEDGSREQFYPSRPSPPPSYPSSFEEGPSSGFDINSIGQHERPGRFSSNPLPGYYGNSGEEERFPQRSPGGQRRYPPFNSQAGDSGEYSSQAPLEAYGSHGQVQYDEPQSYPAQPQPNYPNYPSSRPSHSQGLGHEGHHGDPKRPIVLKVSGLKNQGYPGGSEHSPGGPSVFYAPSPDVQSSNRKRHSDLHQNRPEQPDQYQLQVPTQHWT
jgi:hypothetical protein